ncbi:MAG TPA: hypothetical protein VGQ99_12235 [Tepidisphaeraceae bacterium]|jgi:transposase|nr:hypothetical protein [Tepidisphaeraceae bacterium]
MRSVQRWSKEAILEALRARHERKESLAWVDMPGGLVQSAANRFGGYSKAIEAAGLNYDSVRLYRKWDRESVAAEIRRLYAAGVEMSTKGIRDNSIPLLGAIRAHFGSMAEAMEEAGVPYEGPKSWGKIEVFDKLLKLHQRGEDLSASSLRQRDSRLYESARAAFGSYQRAIEVLGLDYRQVSKRTTWDKASVIAEFRRLAKEGMRPRVSEFMKHAPRLVGAAVKQFGTFVKAIKAADIGYQPRPLWTRKLVVKRLRELHRAGEDLWAAALKRQQGGLYAAAKKFFGSYSKALKKAGIDPAEVARTERMRNGGWCKESIVAALLERQKKGEGLGRGKVPVHLKDAARWHFGSYRKAVEAAGVNYDLICQRRLWDRGSIPKKLMELHEQGEDLSAKSMHEKHGGLMMACWREFGSYQKAVEHAGLDYAEISQAFRWDRETVLGKLRALAEEGVDMSYMALKASHPRLLEGAKRVFGRYPDARVAAGVGPAPLTRWDREKIVKELEKLHSDGENLAVSHMSRNHPALLDAATHHFGSFAEAVQAAGLNYDEIRLARAWTRETIAKELAALDEKDVDLRSGALRAGHANLHQAAYKHFGSYALALNAAGVVYPPKKPLAGWAKSRVLEMLRELHEAGEDLRYASIKKKESSLFFAARYYFDSYIGAVKRAGLDYEAIVREQLHGKKKWKKVERVEGKR